MSFKISLSKPIRANCGSHTRHERSYAALPGLSPVAASPSYVVKFDGGFPRAVAGVITELRFARIPHDAIGTCAPDLDR
jgi:hypothetical protein